MKKRILSLLLCGALMFSLCFQSALAAENALVMDELNPEVRMYLDETKKVLKAHFLALGEEKSAFELEWEEKVEAFSKEERKALYLMLKKSLKAK